MATHVLPSGTYRYYNSFSAGEEIVQLNDPNTGNTSNTPHRRVVIWNLGAQDIFASIDNEVTSNNGSSPNPVGGEYVIPANTSRTLALQNVGTIQSPSWIVRMTPRSGTGNYGVEFF